MHGLKDSIPVREMHGCYEDLIMIELHFVLPVDVTLSLTTISSVVIGLWHRLVWTTRSDLTSWCKISTSTKVFKPPSGVLLEIPPPLCLLNCAVILLLKFGSNSHRDVKKIDTMNTSSSSIYLQISSYGESSCYPWPQPLLFFLLWTK